MTIVDPARAPLTADDHQESPLRVRRVAIVGAGAMGRGIAACTAGVGLVTALCDTNPAALERAAERIASRRRPGDAEVTYTDSLTDAVAEADLIIESVPEEYAVKAAVLTAAEAAAPAHAILATNTSHLPVTEIAAVLNRSGHVIGLHFFNPPPSMGLVEVIPALQTEGEVVTAAVRFVEQLGKTATISRDAPGFISTRGHVAHFLECVRMVQDGVASAEDVDVTCRMGFRHPMGALELGDYVGLDVLLRVAEGMHAAYGDRFLPPPLLRQLVAAGHHGRKSGRGFFDYAPAKGEPS